MLNEKFIQELLRSALVLLFWFFTYVNFYELSNMFLSAQRSLNAIISLLFPFNSPLNVCLRHLNRSLVYGFHTKNVKSHFVFGFIVFVTCRPQSLNEESIIELQRRLSRLIISFLRLKNCLFRSRAPWNVSKVKSSILWSLEAWQLLSHGF